MKSFPEILLLLEQIRKPGDKIIRLRDFFSGAEEEERTWALAMLTGNPGKAVVSPRVLRDWALEISGIPEWLYADSVQAVRNEADAVALLVAGNNPGQTAPSLTRWMQLVDQIRNQETEEKRKTVLAEWEKLDQDECRIFNRILTGKVRVPVSERDWISAVSEATGLDVYDLALRIPEIWDPRKTSFHDLLFANPSFGVHAKPYPFISPLPVHRLEEPGDPTEWHAEWHWEGFRCQLLKRKDQVYVWGAGGELISENVASLVEAGALLPEGTVLEGEILSFTEGVLRSVSGFPGKGASPATAKKKSEASSLILVVYDVLEFQGADLRNQPFWKRREIRDALIQTVPHPAFTLPEIYPVSSWGITLSELRGKALEKSASGLLLKKISSFYIEGSAHSGGLILQPEPVSIRTVLLYAQKGEASGGLFYDELTFGVQGADRLISVAKVSGELTDAVYSKLEKFIKENTLEKFGPVRTVRPELVFEIRFRAVRRSTRHKSGLVLVSPEIVQLLEGAVLSEIHSLEYLKQWL